MLSVTICHHLPTQIHSYTMYLQNMSTFLNPCIIILLFTSTWCAIQDLDNLSEEELLEEVNPDNDQYFKYEIMNEIPAGRFLMGTDAPDANHGENPSKTLTVPVFHMDRYPVTNLHFKRFLRSKKKFRPLSHLHGYSYVVEGFEKRTNEKSFERHPNESIYLKVPHASWRTPEGKGSGVHSSMLNPVVHVSYEDARAYCIWKKKRLPTEIEWEYASRGGKQEKKYPWGGKFEENRTNLWQGEFPFSNLKKDGYEGLSPVDVFEPQNKYGLYDMLGNAWEWTSTVYREKGKSTKNWLFMYVLKGASFVDSHKGETNHLARVTARKGAMPTLTAQNVGFRCALSDDMAGSMNVKRIPEHHEL